MPKTIGIIGTRKRDSLIDYREVRFAFNKVYQEGDRICSGLCPKGGDRFAVIIADELRLPDKERLWFPPKWDDLKVPNARIKYNKWGKPYNAKAGFDRDTDIARESDILIACVAKDRKGGTEDTIKKWKKFHPGKEPILI
jgi:hypothetical protein